MNPHRTASHGRTWHDSLAGVIGDDFIYEHGLKRWVLELDKDIFKNSWFCEDLFTKCEVDKECCKFKSQLSFWAQHYDIVLRSYY